MGFIGFQEHLIREATLKIKVDRKTRINLRTLSKFPVLENSSPGSLLWLQTKVREDFPITKKAPTKLGLSPG